MNKTKKPRSEQEFHVHMGLTPRNRKEKRIARKVMVIDEDDVKKEVDYSHLIIGETYKAKDLEDVREAKILEIAIEKNEVGNEFHCVSWQNSVDGLEYKYLAEIFLETFETMNDHTK